MKIMADTEIIWARVRELNDKSHLYSELADELTKIAQELEQSS